MRVIGTCQRFRDSVGIGLGSQFVCVFRSVDLGGGRKCRGLRGNLDKAVGAAGVSGIQHRLPLPGLSRVDLLGRQQTDAAVVVVVPVEEPTAEGAGILDRAEAVGKFGPVFYRLELAFRIGIVVGGVGPGVGLGDGEIGQQVAGGLGDH